MKLKPSARGIAAVPRGMRRPRARSVNRPAVPAPMIKRGATMKISDHAYVILDDNVGFVPNVGIVVGERATLIVDTGMGPDNGAIVLEEARKLSDNTDFYLTATHFHPEHDLGATAFPANAKMIRLARSASGNRRARRANDRALPGFRRLSQRCWSKASYRKPDTVFDDEMTLDLGGVHVRLSGVGPAHTRGDTVMYVEEDKVLLTGDVVMPVFPAASAQAANIAQWLRASQKFQAVRAARRRAGARPAHRREDASLRYREYLTAVQTQTRAAKRQGQSVEAAQAAIAPALAQQFSDLAPQGGAAATGRINAAIQAAYREAP